MSNVVAWFILPNAIKEINEHFDMFVEERWWSFTHTAKENDTSVTVTVDQQPYDRFDIVATAVTCGKHVSYKTEVCEDGLILGKDIALKALIAYLLKFSKC